MLPVHDVPVVHLGQELDDGIALRKLDFVDVGDWLDPPGGVPVVIESLLFPAATDRVFGQVATTA